MNPNERQFAQFASTLPSNRLGSNGSSRINSGDQGHGFSSNPTNEFARLHTLKTLERESEGVGPPAQTSHRPAALPRVREIRCAARADSEAVSNRPGTPGRRWASHF